MNTILRSSALWRVLLPLILGIVIQYYFRFNFGVWSVLLMTFFFLASCFSLFLKQFVLRYLFGFFMFFCMCFTGSVLVDSMLQKTIWNIQGKYNYSLLLLEDPVLKPKSRMCKVRIVGSDNTIYDQVKGKNVIVYLPVSPETEVLKYGDGIQVYANFKQPEPTQNASFNYSEYLEKQGFAASGYVSNNYWTRQAVSAGFIDKLKFRALSCRDYFVQVMKEIIPVKEHFSVAVGLFIGYKAELSKEIRNMFAETGTAHILAVSGLHLTIVFGILCFVFSPLTRIPHLVPVINLFILLILWAFTFITGLSPSIVRACVMTSFFSIGMILNRRSLTMNSLAASALFMLVYNPLYLFDVGFQLSYGAVISIVQINPYLVRFKEFQSKISGYFWDLSCVSTAAQIGTAPISLFYFGQFPVVFLLTNLFAIPLSGLLLILLPISVLLQLIYDFPPFVYFFLNKILELFITGIEVMNRIPYSVVKGIRCDIWLVISLYAVILLVIQWMDKRQPQYVYAFVFLVVLQVFSYL